MAPRGVFSIQDGQDDPTRAEDLQQIRRILEANVARSTRIQHAICARQEGKAISVADEEDLAVLRELRLYTIKRDELSVRYEEDHAVCVLTQAEARDALEADARLPESRGVYGPRKLKRHWKHCPCVEAKREERSKADEAAGVGAERDNARNIAETARVAFNELKTRIAGNKRHFRDELRPCDTPEGPPLECGFCFECGRLSLQFFQKHELGVLYDTYYDRARGYFDEIVAKIGDTHLTWCPPSKKPLAAVLETSRTISLEDPIMISSIALDVPRRSFESVDSELKESIDLVWKYMEQNGLHDLE